jgi:hypothetical protein
VNFDVIPSINLQGRQGESSDVMVGFLLIRMNQMWLAFGFLISTPLY